MPVVQRFIYPPVWLLFGLVAVFSCSEFYPGPRFISLAAQLAGSAIIVAGLLLLISANGLFTKAGTEVIPFREVKTLVTSGVYRYSRNPMYLGMVLVLLGCATTVGATTALLVPPVFMVIIEWRFIRPEEAMLRDLFPDAYAAYCARVRRWL
jgi:protein-S-isoprenylcysteine O-methyltransferase Ste14